MAKLYDLDRDGDFDLIVLDTPPSRNALDFLDAPDRLTQFFEGRALQVFLRPTGLADADHRPRDRASCSRVLKRVTGDRPARRTSSVFFRSLGGHDRRLQGARQAGQRAAGRPGHGVPARHLARSASRSTRRSSSGASSRRRGCRSAAWSSTASTTTCGGGRRARGRRGRAGGRARAPSWRARWPRTSATTRCSRAATAHNIERLGRQARRPPPRPAPLPGRGRPRRRRPGAHRPLPVRDSEAERERDARPRSSPSQTRARRRRPVSGASRPRRLESARTRRSARRREVRLGRLESRLVAVARLGVAQDAVGDGHQVGVEVAAEHVAQQRPQVVGESATSAAASATAGCERRRSPRARARSRARRARPAPRCCSGVAQIAASRWPGGRFAGPRARAARGGRAGGR